MFSGLKNKNVLITGASGGIGSALARRFAEHGANIGIHYNSDENTAKSLAEEIINLGVGAYCFQADFLSDSYTDLIDRFVDQFNGIDVLINNAGSVAESLNFEELTMEAWRKAFIINCDVPFFLAQRAFSQMKENAGGKIIYISSISAKYGGSSVSLHYGAAKSAGETSSKGLARAGAAHNILVNTIRSGFIDTPFHKNIKNKNLSDRIDMIPLKRAGKPEEVADMALHLASDSGNFITGEIFTVAGGD